MTDEDIIATGESYSVTGHTFTPNSFVFGGMDNIEIMRLSRDGVWVNPDIPVDDAAKAVIAALDGYIKSFILQENEACAQLVEKSYRGIYDSSTCAAAIRARMK